MLKIAGHTIALEALKDGWQQGNFRIAARLPVGRRFGRAEGENRLASPHAPDNAGQAKHRRGKTMMHLRHGGDGSMRTRTSWLAGLLLVLLCTPSTVRAQGPHFGSPQTEMPLPLMWGDRDTGPYVAFEAIYMRLNVSYHNQLIAVRGFRDESGFIDGSSDPDNFAVNG